MSAVPDVVLTPPDGFVRAGGQLLLRRHGLVRPRDLTCIHGHRIRVRGTPFEVAIPCDTHIAPGRDGECGALVYVITTRHRGLLWFTDLSAEEASLLATGDTDLLSLVHTLGISHRRRATRLAQSP